MKLNPTELLVYRFGPSKSAAARRLGISRQTLQNWLREKKVTEAGQIPSNKYKEFLALAKDQNIPLSAEELIYGAEV